MAEAVWAVGLMSGTSLDGIDAALIRTDGERVSKFGAVLTHVYEPDFRERLRGLLGRDPCVTPEAGAVEAELTRLHAAAVRALLDAQGMAPSDVRIAGFHGHTVLHRPELRVTRQLGDAEALARQVGIDVVGGLRLADMAAGGEGAPLAPVYHRALAAELPRPLCVLNLGGVGNVTWIGADDRLLAFDTGPGNALIDDWAALKSGLSMDEGGCMAAKGRVSAQVLAELTGHPYLTRPPPKSLDRDDFKINPGWTMSAEDGAATLTAFTAEAVARGREFLPARPKSWLVTGGGRRNKTLMTQLRMVLQTEVRPVEAVGWRGDALEAQAFGFLAVRSLGGLPLSYPGTTGVPEPKTGGVLYRAA